MQPDVLVAHDLHKSYGSGGTRFHALRGVSLNVHQGEALAIVGKSGSGKSTLMHLLALLDTPDSGTVTVAGLGARERSARVINRIRNETFGFVFQQFFMVPNATVLDNVALPLAIAGVDPRERTRRGMDVLEQVELADKASNRATALSGGQKQRMVIARALVNRPKVIFADEPTGNLDSATGTVVTDLLFERNARDGITLVLVTHDEELAARCARRLTIRDGTIVDETGGAPAERRSGGAAVAA